METQRGTEGSAKTVARSPARAQGLPVVASPATPRERVQRAQASARQFNPRSGHTPNAKLPLRDYLLSAIDNIVYGEDPSERGLCAAGASCIPKLGFTPSRRAPRASTA